MTGFTPQSTDRLNDNTNPRLTNVVLEGSTTITLAAVASGYRGVTAVSLPLDTDYANLDVEAWAELRYPAPGYEVVYLKMPNAVSSSAGAFSQASWITVAQASKLDHYEITFGLQIADIVDFSVSVYYRILSSRIKPDGLSFT